MDKKEYLYHYTSIENLALIMKYRTIRLNPLDKMDDLQEQKTADIENLGKFVFISSWTDDTTESIPMWKMYTDPKSGVRIKLQKNPFVWHGTTGKAVSETIGAIPIDDTSLSSIAPTFLDLSKLMDKGCMSPQAWNGKILEKVTYTDNLEKLEPKVLNISEDKINIRINDMGRCKSTYWSFQNEWRYIMTFLPMDFKCSPEETLEKFTLTGQKLIQGIETPPFRFYDLDIAPEFFNEMEITCSPQMTPGNRILLDSLVEKYNPKAVIQDSSLIGKL